MRNRGELTKELWATYLANLGQPGISQRLDDPGFVSQGVGVLMMIWPLVDKRHR